MGKTLRPGEKIVWDSETQFFCIQDGKEGRKTVLQWINSTPPSRNASNTLLVTGATVSDRISTMVMIGSTATSDSSSFSCNLFRYTLYLPYSSSSRIR